MTFASNALCPRRELAMLHGWQGTNRMLETDGTGLLPGHTTTEIHGWRHPFVSTGSGGFFFFKVLIVPSVSSHKTKLFSHLTSVSPARRFAHRNSFCSNRITQNRAALPPAQPGRVQMGLARPSPFLPLIHCSAALLCFTFAVSGRIPPHYVLPSLPHGAMNAQSHC